jgi:branched-chain amino acid transport system ATP-binding protein
LLRIENIEVIYNNVILVLKGVSLEVPDGKVVSLLGANGAGKTTTLKAISGLLYTELGEVTRGKIEWGEKTIQGTGPEEIVKAGIVQVLEGRPIFEHLTVEENIKIGAYSRKDRENIEPGVKRVYDLFPLLVNLKGRTSGYLSGGERQMLVIGKAMMANPSLLLLDEPSLGLSPMLVKEVFKTIKRINEEDKTSILLVEQNAMVALSASTYGYIMENGHIVMDGPTEQLMRNEDIKEFYLGLSQVGKRKSYRDIKHYKRRKRWLS